MSDAPMKPDPLEQELSALKAQTNPPGADLIVRVLQDADATQKGFIAPTPPTRPKLTRRFIDVIGGWPSMAGLATAGIAGVWIGLSQPAMLIAGSQALFYGETTDTLVDLDPGFGFSDLEGGL